MPREVLRVCYCALPTCSVAICFGPKTLDDDVNFLHEHTWSSSGTSSAAQNILWAVREGIVLGVYEPVGNAVKILIVDGHPTVAFIVNIVLHLANCALARALGMQFLHMRVQHLSSRNHRVVPSGLAADLSAALFAGHPICVESVAWSSCQPVLLATFLSAAAMHVYFQPSPMPWSCRRASGWLLLCACLSKATAITVPIYIYMLGTEALATKVNSPGTRVRNYLGSIRRDPTLFCVTLLGGGNHSGSIPYYLAVHSQG